MWRYLVGAGAALALASAAAMLIGRKPAGNSVLPPAPVALVGDQAGSGATPLPDAVPEASERTREEKRFDRYDKDRNGGVSREEYLAQRRKAFARLDTNHDGVLSFDEWAAKASAKFAAADRDRTGVLTRGEFAATAVKRKPKRARADCPPADRPSAAADD